MLSRKKKKPRIVQDQFDSRITISDFFTEWNNSTEAHASPLRRMSSNILSLAKIDQLAYCHLKVPVEVQLWISIVQSKGENEFPIVIWHHGQGKAETCCIFQPDATSECG
ncbi:hypothetical protein CDAR_506531 [Caerostris darwini]|uniref:Uncharacterized protein n=1 Tax=Caerostris darwini TaxID=1538125 RepID=A0AAV4Q9T4_9ARAC|nr:hypothetical protein CDAR_506531 [Caerostris darwini]